MHILPGGGGGGGGGVGTHLGVHGSVARNMYPGGQVPPEGGSVVVVVVQLHSVPCVSIHKPGPGVVVLVVVGPGVVVLSGKQGNDGDNVVPKTPPTTSPPLIQAVIKHSNGTGQKSGRIQPQGAAVVVVVGDNVPGPW